ncbi:MAG: ATP-binding protein [Chloroflexi bacterium]|nr:ATP-binding protein [Chloroflexota bacterium]
MAMDRTKARDLLQAFEFEKLLIEIGWESVPPAPPRDIGDTGYQYRLISQTVFEVFPLNASADGLPNARMRAEIHKHIEKISFENLIIFLDNDEIRTQSVWYWVKREGNIKRPRPHEYWIEQPGDLFLSKIADMVIEMGDRRADGTLPISERTRRFADSFDIRPVTKNFYKEFSGLREDFGSMIDGIPSESDRLLYASVLLNRLMFIYFLQKKGFIQENVNYLDDKLDESQERGPERYYSEFLSALFFEGFAKPARERGAQAKGLLGPIPYLNGGLFIPHQLEQRYSAIRIPDIAFEDVLRLFGEYSWYLDDTQGADDNVINPDVLGYIFEKYINQKAFGAYYTRTEITEYLCKRSIHAVLLQRVNQHSVRQFNTWGDVLERLDANLCNMLLFEILPKLSILDPACGSGAFLVAALKNLIYVYSAIYGRIDFSNNDNLLKHKAEIQKKHPSLHYYIRKKIITDNLYGVDIMDEATEIARLRLFLALVSVAKRVEHLEPLPNIDFNIMAGNSLIGLLSVDDTRFDEKKQMQYMFQEQAAENYRREVAEKNRLVRLFRDAAGYSDTLDKLRRTIDDRKLIAYQTLNDILLDDFRALKIQYEQARLKGKAVKRQLETTDIEALTPFHWGYEFDEIISTRGGFDVIITNPPWEVFQTDEKEFFQQFDPLIQKKKLRITDWKKQRRRLMEDPEIRDAWLEYASSFPHVSRYIKTTPQYRNQISRMNGKIVSRKINLYSVFTEQCFNLLREGGACGIVIPSGIYSDLGTKQLRQMLFEENQVTGLFGFENRKKIFEDVDSRFKFVVLSFEKGGSTAQFPAAFMRHEVSELEGFPTDDGIHVGVDLIKRSSPSSLSVTEFKNEFDLRIVEKMLEFPLLGDDVPGKWQVTFRQELNMTSDSSLFYEEPGEGRLPLYEGKMIWQFEHGYAPPRYWIDEAAGRARVLGKRGEDSGQTLDYQMYRLAHRSIARSTDTRTLVASVVPRTFAGHSLNVWDGIEPSVIVTCVAVMNSFVVDWLLRQSVSANITMFFVYQLPVPRLMPGDRFFDAIVRRAAQLICTAPEYDDLAAEVGLGNHHKGVTNPAGRARLRAELDGIIAHIYGLTEDEFAYVLSTFPLVADSVKAAALAAYRDVARGDLA